MSRRRCPSVTAATLLAAFVLAGCDRKQAAPPPPPMAEVATVTVQPQRVVLFSNGGFGGIPDFVRGGLAAGA